MRWYLLYQNNKMKLVCWSFFRRKVYDTLDEATVVVNNTGFHFLDGEERVECLFCNYEHEKNKNFPCHLVKEDEIVEDSFLGMLNHIISRYVYSQINLISPDRYFYLNKILSMYPRYKSLVDGVSLNLDEIPYGGR